RFAQRFAGAKVVQVELHDADPRVDAFLFDRDGKRELVLVNKTTESMTCALPAGITAAPILTLHAAAIEAKDGVEISSMHERHHGMVKIAEYCAAVYLLAKS
ncbi:MAG TPA: hypothetical protein VK593_05250, partial [Edaphobacter sp.]|nr:hypothetical protein [Edaphobacter sp.]